MHKKLICFFVGSIIALSSELAAVLWLPDIYGDNMVLQAEQPLVFRGKSDAGARVEIEILDAENTVVSRGSAVVGEDGVWNATLPAVQSNLDVTVRVQTNAGDSLLFDNVLTGEVWLCSGQSNMRWTVEKSMDADAEVAAADYPGIRLFQVELGAASVPLGNLRGQWVVCSPETVGGFSGAGYFFGRDLFLARSEPVGLINSTWGGTPVQAWIPEEALRSKAETRGELSALDEYDQTPREERARDGRGDWIYGAKYQKAPSRLYNAMIYPLIPFPIKGVLWCQGEANDREGKWGGPSLYHTLFPMLIRSWREAWGQGDFPFVYVELANFMKEQQTPVGEEEAVNWAFIREAQARALELPNVFAVSVIDLGEADDIHYRNKQAVGARLTLAVLGEVYDEPVGEALSPRYVDHDVENGKVRIRLANAESGLSTDDGNPPSAFAIRSEGGEWFWAETSIEDGQILVWHPEVSNPAAVRHAWASNPNVNVYNAAGLPLMPFRTDP